MTLNVLKLGLEFDGAPAVAGARQVGGAFDDVGESGGRLQKKVEHLSIAVGFAIGSMATDGVRDVTSLMRSVTALGFAFDPVVGAVTLAGTAIVDRIVETSRVAREESKKMADALMADARRLEDYAKGALAMRLNSLQGQRESIMRAIDTQGKKLSPDPTTGADRFAPQVSDEELHRLDELDVEIRKVNGALKDMNKSEAAKAAEALKRGLSEAKTAAHELGEELDKRFDKNIDDEIKRAQAAAKANEADDIKAFNDETARQDQLAKDAIANSDAIGEANKKNDKEHADAMDQLIAKAKALRDALLAGIAGSMFGALSAQGGVMGAIGGAGSGAMAGAAAGGVPGAVFGGLMGLTSGLLGLGKAEEAAREAARLLRLQFDAFVDSTQAQLGIITDTELRIRQTKAQFEALKHEMGLTTEQIDGLEKGLKAFGLSTDSITQQRKEAEKLAVLEAQRIQQIIDEGKALNETMQQDLEVRKLRAQGKTEEADALELALKQQREYTDAVKAGADATTLSKLAEVQRMEVVAKAIERTQAKIDSLAGTIVGLEDFRNSLKLTESVSPTDRLAEAKKQYDAIVALALSGDQSAASRLPGAAQTFLDASRSVNASGSAFQADFAKVLADTQSALDKFGDLKTIEELMLEQLIAIRDNTGLRLNEGPTGPIFGLPSTESTAAIVAALVDGFSLLSQQLDGVETAVNEGTAATARSFDGFALRQGGAV